jgi:hypothetical protein
MIVNKDQLNRITGKLDTLRHNCRVKAGSPVYNVVFQYVTQYQATIIKAMASVDGATGGAASFDIAGKSASIYWEALSEYTVRFKEQHGLSAYIWNATGDTQSAVKVEGVSLGASTRFFAGISKAANQTEYERALAVEFGADKGTSPIGSTNPDKWEARPLFTIANQLIKDNRQQITEAIRFSLMSGVNWGS